MKEPRSITGTILNVFTERICRRINYLSIESPNSPLWDDPMKMYLRVEQDPLEVDSIIFEAKKNKDRYSNINLEVYRGVLSRVYIILYYRHHDDELYKKIVFPRLIENMGYFSQNYLRKINDEIDNLLKQEEMIDNRKKQTSTFTIPKLCRGELDELFDEYNKEKLFREFVAFYDEQLRPDNVILDCAKLWYVAKDFIRKLWHSPNPESYIERILRQLEYDKNTDFCDPQFVIICMYIIMRAINGNHFAKTIEKIEGYENRQTDFHYLSKTIHLVKHWINEVHPYDGDYDYLSEQNEVESSINDENNTISSKSIATAELEQRNRKLEEDNKKLKQQIEELTKNNYKNETNSDREEINALKEEIETLKMEIKNKDSQISGATISSKDAAILTITACYYGGRWKNRKNLYPILTNLFHIGEALAKRRLGERIKQEDADNVAKCFDQTSPKIANIIRNMPDVLKQIKN